MRIIAINIIWSSSLLAFRMKLATSSDINKVLDSVYKDFMPGEPVSRSMGFVKDGRVEMGKVWKMMNKVFIKPMLTKGTSIIAVNEKDEIVGKSPSAYKGVMS